MSYEGHSRTVGLELSRPTSDRGSEPSVRANGRGVKFLVLIYQNPQDTDRSNSSKLVDALADKHDSGLIEDSSNDSMAPEERLGSWHAYDVAVEGDTMIAVRDGIRPATDIYFPS